MYTFGAIAPRSLQLATKTVTPKLAVAPRIGMIATARTIAPAKTVTQKLATAPLAPASTAPAPDTKPQQVQVVLVPPQEKKSSEPEEKWYRSPGFIGGVASAVILGVIGVAFEKMSKKEET